MTAPSMGDAQRRISVASDPTGTRIRLDDTDISRHIQGYTIEHRVMQSPMVVLYAAPATDVVFAGMAHVAVAAPEAADPGEAIAAFLGSINPAALDAAAFQRDDLDGSPNELTKAMLAQLVDWAMGR